MDLTKFLGQDTQEPSAQRLSKEEYAAQKKQEREEIWGMIDGKAQEIFQNGDSLKGFLDFMGQCKPQRTDNQIGERRVGKECRIGCRSRWSPYH